MLLSGEGPIKDRLRPRLGMFHGRLHYLHRLGVMDLFEKGKWGFCGRPRRLASVRLS